MSGCSEPHGPADEPADYRARSAGLTSTAGLDNPLLFDAQYYAGLYSDLRLAFGSDAKALRNHWLVHGIYESRRASPIFDCGTYLALNSDVASAYGTDCAAAMNHFLASGLPSEGRRAAIEFDVRYYLSQYPDLVAAFGAAGYQAAASHFLTYGLWQEGRQGSSEFDASYYICHDPDLTDAFYGNFRAAIQHFSSLGLPQEGRRGSRHFDVRNYLARYPELARRFGTDYRAAALDWLASGAALGRTGDPGDGGGTSLTCAAGTQVVMHNSETTAATGFPTSWYGYPLPAGALSYAGLNGTVAVTNSADIYSEVLFIIGYLPSGTCTSGLWPASTPEYGPPGMIGLTNLIVKAPTAGTYSVPANFTIPGGLPMSGCLLIGLNGGTVAGRHNVTATSSLTLTYTGAASSQRILGGGSEFCFGQSWGCQLATTNTALSFASVQMVSSPSTLVALFGDISDSTFDGSRGFGAPPAGPWTALNDFYIYHGAECLALGAGPGGGPAGPADFYGTVPPDAVHLLSVPLSGSRIGAAATSVFQRFATPLSAGDCLVTLTGIQGGGAFDNETQVSALVQ